MIKYREMSKRAKIHIVFMWICGIGNIILGAVGRNIWGILIGIMFLLEIIDTYTHEEDQKIIEDYETMLEKYHNLVEKQNIMIWKLRGESKENEE